MKFYLKNTSVNNAVSLISVDNFEEGTNIVAVTSKVFSLIKFYIFISIKHLSGLQLILV